MGARANAAAADAVAARDALLEEVVRLEAAARAAIDLPAKARDNPIQTAALAAGTLFLLAGGPRRVLRRIRRSLRGPEPEEPPALLPAEIERILRRLGEDGDRIRGALERDFARYVEERTAKRRARGVSETAGELLTNLLGPVSRRAGRRLAEELFAPDAGAFGRALDSARERWAERTTPGEDGDTPDAR